MIEDLIEDLEDRVQSLEHRVSRIEDCLIILHHVYQTPEIHRPNSIFVKCFHDVVEEILGDRPLGDGLKSPLIETAEKGSA